RRRGRARRHYATDMVEMRSCYRHPDRETAVSCSECGRPICPDCMVFAPVGIRCPDHAGISRPPRRVPTRMRRAGLDVRGAVVTKALIATNVLIYLIELAAGAPVNGNGGWIWEKGALFACDAT